MSNKLGFALLLVLAASSCKTVDKVNGTLDSSKKAADNVSQLAKNFNDALNELKAQAKNNATVAPAAAAKVPTLPTPDTGGAATSTPVAGKTGSGNVDVDGSGSPKDVDVFVADASTAAAGGIVPQNFATSDDATTFLAWAGNAQSHDEGTCYLGWEHGGKDWFIIASCGAATGWVCSDDGTTSSCSACNEAGECTPCDDNQPLDQCAAPAAGGADAGADDAATVVD